MAAYIIVLASLTLAFTLCDGFQHYYQNIFDDNMRDTWL